MSSLAQTMTQTPAYDGQPANVVELVNSAGMRITLMDIGADWLSCVVPLKDGEQREVMLGVNNMDDYRKMESFLGATIGRYANRINKGQFVIDGTQYQVATNQAGNCLHGGPDGFDKRRWVISEQTPNKVTFTIASADGDQGFPGNLTASITYQLSDDNSVLLTYTAQTDKTTPVNLTNHGYFNLQGATPQGDIRQHRLQINADAYLPTNEVSIPLRKSLAMIFASRKPLPKISSREFSSNRHTATITVMC